MQRRHFIPVLLAGAASGAQDRMSALFGDAHGTALVTETQGRRLRAMHAPELAARLLAPPGSTVKPFTIATLLEAGKLRADDSFRCPGALEIGGRNLACSHSPGLPPMQAQSAIAYSCNCFVAHYAARLEPGEVARSFGRWGLLSRSQWMEGEAEGELSGGDVRLQSLGESGVRVTPAGLAMAYTRLAALSSPAWMSPVRAGLEDAVEYGTAQHARVAGTKVAGKTGSVRTAEGAHLAWFAGFTPKYAIAVVLQGRSGGADAAPIASRILEAACHENW